MKVDIPISFYFDEILKMMELNQKNVLFLDHNFFCL